MLLALSPKPSTLTSVDSFVGFSGIEDPKFLALNLQPSPVWTASLDSVVSKTRSFYP